MGYGKQHQQQRGAYELQTISGRSHQRKTHCPARFSIFCDWLWDVLCFFWWGFTFPIRYIFAPIEETK